MKSIRTKFVLLVLGCLFSACVVVGGAGILNSKKVLDRDSIQIMRLLCKQESQSINSLLSRIEQSVRTLAVHTANQIEDMDRFRTDPAYAETRSKDIEEVAVNTAQNTEGALGIYVRFNPEYTSPTAGFFYSKSSANANFQRLTPTDLSRYQPTELGHVGWYYLPVENESAIWLDPYLNKNTNVWMISYVIPLYLDGTIVGVVGMDINFDLLQGIVDQTHVYETGYAFLSDDQARIVHHRELKMGDSLLEASEGSLDKMVEQLQSQTAPQQLFSYSYFGEQKKMTFETLDNGLKFVLTAPSCEIDKESNQLMLQIAAATLLFLSVATILTLWATRQLVKPLQELNQAARKIAEGDLSVSITHHSRDEVGMLAESFRITAQHLEKHISYINGLAYRDGLTGVKNKTAYLDAVAALEERIQARRAFFAVAVFDLNNLKTVNDNMGHEFGDLLIIDASKIICTVFKHSPVYRIGGDEFVVLLEHSDFHCHTQLAEQFESVIQMRNRPPQNGPALSVACGIAIYDQATDRSYSDVFQRADEAMYQNKAQMKKDNTPPRE